jgi:hypothetical protein
MNDAEWDEFRKEAIKAAELKVKADKELAKEVKAL